MASLRKLANYCSAELTGEIPERNWEPLIDSRLLNNPENTIFFAIVTGFNDGHKYIDELYNKGVRVFVISSDLKKTYNDAAILKVANTLQALQSIAKGIRSEFTGQVIGITGSNGKTIVKEWLNQLLSVHLKICSSPKSFNSQLGVPISVWPLNNSYDLGIFEAGISTTGEMELLEDIIHPQLGILTHLGPAHNQGFDNPEQKLSEKLKLFKNTQCLLTQYNLSVMTQYKGKLLTYDFDNSKADLNITTKLKKGKSTELIGLFKDNPLAFQIPFTDDASIENACICALTLLYLNKFESSGFNHLQAVSMRLELKKGIHGSLLVNDSYSNDLHSLSTALNFLSQQSVHTKKTVILSDIEESGLPPELLYSNVKRMMTDRKISRLIGIGGHFKEQRAKFSELDFTHFDTTDDFLNSFNKTAFRDESILVKGARKFAFEKIVARLQQETHGTVLEINLSAALNNLSAIRNRLSPGMKIMAMVKAFAYGSGTYEMAKLICNKVEYLAVAYTDEGVALRNNGIETPIMVMNPEEESLEQLLNYKLEPVIFGIGQLKSIIAYLSEMQSNETVRIHIELDTGMHRLGFMENDLDELIELLKNNDKFEVASIFSHLSASDEAVHDEFTRFQFDQMNSMAVKLNSALRIDPLKHISNTAATLRFTQEGLDMVRLGIGLYGIDPTGLYGHLLEPVFTLKTSISQIKTINANESIGYSRRSVSGHQRKIAILALGYADGLNRALSNGKGGFMINGKFAPIAGNVCMDMCMADVTEIECEEGDEAILFGKEKSIEDLAKQLNTIPYEVLTSISQRVKRVYVSE